LSYGQYICYGALTETSLVDLRESNSAMILTMMFVIILDGGRQIDPKTLEKTSQVFKQIEESIIT
jgi:hypothetical protein